MVSKVKHCHQSAKLALNEVRRPENESILVPSIYVSEETHCILSHISHLLSDLLVWFQLRIYFSVLVVEPICTSRFVAELALKL